VLAKSLTPTSLFALGGTLFFTNGTKDVSSCTGQACMPSLLVNGPSVKAQVAATADGIVAIDTTCGNAMRSDGVYLYARNGTGTLTLGDPCPTSVTAAGTFLFSASAGLETLGTSWSVQRCNATSCETIAGDTIVSPFGTPKVVAATPTDVYVGTASGRIVHWPNQPNAGAGTVLVQSEFFTNLVTDGKLLAWIDGSRVRACTIADCAGTVRTVASDATARRLAADDSGLYWTSAGSGGADGKVLHVAPAGEAPVVLAGGQTEPDGIALDGGFVYWTTRGCAGCAAGEGAILRQPKP
jgi:hypothetical protein